MTTAVIISVPKLTAKLVCDNVRTGGPGGEEAVFATEVKPWVEDCCDRIGEFTQTIETEALVAKFDCDNS